MGLTVANAVVEYWRVEVWPSTIAGWQRLDVPTWDVFNPALQECVSDLWKASQSTVQLSYLTLRPVAILGLMILEGLWEVAQVLFRVLLSQGWIQLKKGCKQLRAAAIWIYHFQMSLSRMELLGEVALVAAMIGLYYFYRWIRRQTYWQRFTKWYIEKKQRSMERTSKFIDRVARVSLILAMAVPHTVFLGAYVAFKVIFPAFVKWLAYDTYTTALISIWYPLIMTLSWVHDKRQSKESHASPATSAKHSVSTLSSKDTPTPVEPNSSESSDDRRPAYMRTKASQKLRESTTNKRNPAVFPRTSPPKPETPQRKSQEEGQRRPTSPAMNFLLNNEPEAATRYWLRYWVVFALVQSVGTLATMVPVFGNFVVRHPYVLHICSELKLLFFIWLFSMETLIGAAVVQEDALMAKAMPLNLLHEHIAPLLLELEAVVAESVSKKTWTSLIHSKVQRVLEVFVMLKMLSDHRKDWLLHILDEGRTLLLPSLSLFMPSFITQFGVAYVQFIVPSAKSTRALIAAKQRRTQGSVKNEDVELLYLQYWIIHCLVSGLLGYFSVIIWWIPFSTHATFLVWCHLSFPKSITQSYHVLETELVAFGLLPGKSELQLHETKTVKVIQAVCSRLPSAADKEEKKHEEGSKTGKQESNGDQESSHLPLGRTISVDSQQTSVEVSIREPSKAFVKGRKKACDYDGAMNDNESSAELLEDTNSCKKRPTKHTSVKEDEDDSSMPPIKPSESSTTADTGSTHISHDVASVDSASSNGSTSSNKDPPTNLRRSTRQRRTTT